MKITVIDGDVSYPANSGKRLRTLNLLLPLARQHEITYLARSESAANHQAEMFFRDHGIEPILVEAPLPSKKAGSAFYAKLGRNLLSPLPYSVTSHVNSAMLDAARTHSARNPIDVWQLEWSGYGYCVENSGIPVVLQAHNIDALLWRRYGEAEQNPLRRAFIAEQERKFIRFERRAFQRASRIIAVSAADADAAQKLYGPLPIDVVDNGVDVAAMAAIAPDLGSRKVLFLGALDWRPNIDAIQILLKEIWPRVRLAEPGAGLNIVGRSPSRDLVRQIHQATAEGVELHADVPDVRPFLRACAVMAVPLRIGGGSRLKVLEAMAAGLPVVSTGIGAEGLALVPGRHFLQADEGATIAAELVTAIRSPDAMAEMARLARTAVSRRYDWTALAACLEQSWERSIETSGKPLRSN